MSFDGAWESLFWAVFQRSSNPIVILDDCHRIVEVNDAVTELLGASRLELLGSDIEDRFSPATRERARSEWERLRRARSFSGTRLLVRADGTDVEVEFAARMVELGARALAVGVVLPVGRVRFFRDPTSTAGGELSHREHEVVALIALGHDTNAIAEELHISPATVRSHVKNAMQKLGVHTRAHLVAVALCDHLPRLADVGAAIG